MAVPHMCEVFRYRFFSVCDELVPIFLMLGICTNFTHVRGIAINLSHERGIGTNSSHAKNQVTGATDTFQLNS